MSISAEIAARRANKAVLKTIKAESVEAKRQVAIEKARARLEKLLNKTQPVGRMAIIANRKPSKGKVATIDMLEANEIAKKFALRKSA